MYQTGKAVRMFQHTAARRRLEPDGWTGAVAEVSTHSRPKAAAKFLKVGHAPTAVSTHSRPKAAAARNSQ